MSQSPITVTYSLEEVLARIERKIDENFNEVNHKFDKVNQKLEDLQEAQNATRVTIESLKGGIKALDEKLTGKINGLDVELKGLSKRLENQEFLSRGVSEHLKP